ncbi:MAG: DUF1542 domain-containing protein [Eubacterium sp.]|nr:DUF1542 domain-containing protein [Eubacterium sp.]
MKSKLKKIGKKLTALCLTAVMLSAVQGTPVSAGETDTGTPRAATILNPRVESDPSMQAGQKTTWDCVYFGRYPQSEVTGSALTSAVTGAAYDTDGDAYVDGTKYRRINTDDGYRYFRWESVKWRVLHTDGSTALLLSDMALDNQPYYTSYTPITWEKSTMRSWLNGYGDAGNEAGIDYGTNNFIDTAFTGAEQAAIRNTVVENTNNLDYGADGGNNTEDRLFLLSESELCATDEAASYGFVKDRDTNDEARRCKGSAYAEAKGLWVSASSDCERGCEWRLRSPSNGSHDTSIVLIMGKIVSQFWTDSNVDYSLGVRAALNLDLSSRKSYGYAGTVSSDGTSEEGGGLEGEDELANAKEQGKGMLDVYKNMEDYREAQRNELKAAIETGKTAIDAAMDEDGVRDVLEATKAAIDKIKTDAQLTQEEKNNGEGTSGTSGNPNGNSGVNGTPGSGLNQGGNGSQVSVLTPKGTVIQGKIKAKSKGFTIRWKKQTGIDGYQIQVSQSKNFKKYIYQKTIKKTKAKITIKKLKDKKKYYVRIRTYKNVGGQTLYSGWSKKKSVRLK